jgi:hypothetical protein
MPIVFYINKNYKVNGWVYVMGVIIKSIIYQISPISSKVQEFNTHVWRPIWNTGKIFYFFMDILRISRTTYHAYVLSSLKSRAIFFHIYTNWIICRVTIKIERGEMSNTHNFKIFVCTFVVCTEIRNVLIWKTNM